MFSMLLFWLLQATAPVSPETQPVFTPDSFVVDYGTVAYGSDGNRDLYFTNTGGEPLLIQNVQTSCGCTVPAWPKEPILPGKSGKLSIHYDTKRTGEFHKTLTVFTNEPDGSKQKSHAITVKGIVGEAISPVDVSAPTGNR